LRLALILSYGAAVLVRLLVALPLLRRREGPAGWLALLLVRWTAPHHHLTGPAIAIPDPE
jgi:hypothetical protein